MLGLTTDQLPIALYWSICWSAGLAGGISLALATSLWEIEELSAFLAKVDAAGAVSRAIPGPLLRELALRLILVQVAFSCAASALHYTIGLDENAESNRNLLTLLRYAQILVVDPARLNVSLKAERPDCTVSAFSRLH